jgi:TonB family protein
MNRLHPALALLLTASVSLPAADTATPTPAPIKQAGTDVPKPERTRLVKPVYPSEALARGEHALVIVEMIIDETGHVAEAQVIRGAEPFARAALEAVRQWEFRPSRVDGRPVRVRYTQPITFSAPLPVLKRDKGIPELRQGVSPKAPAAAKGQKATVVVKIEVDVDGRVAEAVVHSGDSPFREAVLDAIHTWRFAPPEGGAVGFDAHADFASDESVSVELKGARKGTATGPATAAASAAAPPASATAAPGPSEPSTEEIAPIDAVESAPPAVVSSEPPVEVVSTRSSAPTPGPAERSAPATPEPPPENGTSNVRDVELSQGIPDLVQGRRPASPPMARMGDIEGDVEVRFSIDAAGATAVLNVSGRDELKSAAESLVRSWNFRRTAPQRLYALAQVEYRTAGSKAKIRLVP